MQFFALKIQSVQHVSTPYYSHSLVTYEQVFNEIVVPSSKEPVLVAKKEDVQDLIDEKDLYKSMLKTCKKEIGVERFRELFLGNLEEI